MKLFVYNNFDFCTICVHTTKLTSRSTRDSSQQDRLHFTLPRGIAEKALGADQHSLQMQEQQTHET